MKIDLTIMLSLTSILFLLSSSQVSAHTDVTVRQAKYLIDSTPDLTVVDVREPYEYCDARGHIPGALNYPLSSGVLQARYEELPVDAPILVVCRSGDRSNQAANFLDSHGFTQVYDMMGGMSAWSWETEPCKYSGGHGTADDPYQIATAEDLMLLGESTEDYHKHFILTADIDLDPNLPGRRVFDRAVIAAERPFRGVFDGKNHTISNLTIIGENAIGLFGVLNYGAMISNLSLVAIDINGKSYIGGLVGVNGYWGSGGLINYCYSTGVVNGDSCIGGLVGVNDDGSIIASYSTATVGGGGSIGGLVGQNGGTWSVELDAHITECYSGGVVTGNSDVGGLVGSNYGIIARCYSLTTVTGESSIGGLVGGPGGQGRSVSASFWDMEASGQATSAAGTGLTTAEMTMASTFLNAGWDFVDETLNGTCDYWQISLNNYPRLSYHLGHIPVMPEGTGTSEEPYLIRDARDLGTMCLKPMAHYRLEMSVDLSGTTWSVAVVPWFEGTFDGNTHVIRNLHIEGGGRLGLFGRLVSGATVSNLGLEAVDVSGSGKSVGALVGQSEFDCSIIASYSSGFVNGNEFVGGLVGINRYGSNITSCYSTGSVGGNGNSVGGLVGSNGYGSNITSCYSTGSVGGNGNSVGGLVGSNYYESSISSSYSSCVVTGNSDVGGLVGLSWRSDINTSFWDIETSGQATSDGGTGKTTAEMQDIRTYQDAGWDLVGEIGNGTHEIWQMPEQGGYPVLGIFNGYVPPSLEGMGTVDDPYLISNARELGAIVYYNPYAYYRLSTSIDLLGIQWGTSVIPHFEGTFAGGGHKIKNLRIKSSTDYLGLFGQLGKSGNVFNLHLETVDVNGIGGYVGSLVGSNNGTITASGSTGFVKGGGWVGGFVGRNNGSIIASYSSVQITGDTSVGGLVGRNYGIVTDCYSTGEVRGSSSVGGLVGYNLRTVVQCYSTGLVSSTGEIVGGLVGDGSPTRVTSSVWDIQTSGWTSSAGGTGLTTAEMQTASTFLDAGWDFVDETANGTDDIWWILEGQGYPRLWWELIPVN